MNEQKQVAALFRAFLARFFENEISEGTRDMRSSFGRMIGMLAAPGFLLPFANLYRWSALAFQGGEVLRLESIADKVIYLSMATAAMMLLSAVVWQALLVDKRDAIVLGSFPVRPRVIVLGKLAALFGYLVIVAAGMNVIASLAYGSLLGGGVVGMLRSIPAHFVASMLACIFACTTVAAIQALVLAIGGPRLFARLTAPAQMVLAAVGLAVLLFSPMFGAAAVDAVRGNPRSFWVLWLPPMWFVGIYETIVGSPAALMPAMALRGLMVFAAVAVLIAAYPLAYHRIAKAAIQGSPIGTRQSAASALLAAVMRRLPVRHDVRGAAHFTCLTLGRVARNKLVVAAALGAATAIALPFILRWTSAAWHMPVPGRSHIAISFLFGILGLAGMRMAYNVPSEPEAAWIFKTAHRPARIGASAARVVAFLVVTSASVVVYLPVLSWHWGPAIGVSHTLTVLALAWLIAEMGLRTVDFVPFTRPYNPERGGLQAKLPLYLMAGIFFLQFMPWAVQQLLIARIYWLAPVVLFTAAAVLRLFHPPEPPPLVDADHENRPLALRLY